jgi:hypothetical protein
MKLYIPPQLKRLTLAFAIFVSLFLLVRNMLVPATFGQYGHYRGASLAENADHENHFAGQTACLECHQDIEDIKLTDVHSTIRCEACHGPGQKHVTSGEAADIVKPGSREFCGNCHKKNAAKRLTTIVQIDLNIHNAGKNCIECHNPHKPWEVKE